MHDVISVIEGSRGALCLNSHALQQHDRNFQYINTQKGPHRPFILLAFNAVTIEDDCLNI